MSTPVQPTPAPNVELELAKLANEAMAQGADPHDVTGKLHQTISYLRQFPQMAEHATNALADGVASPADISRTLWPHVSAMQHANGAPGVSNAPTDQEAANLPPDNTVRSRIGGGLAAFESGIPGGEALTTGLHALTSGQPYRTAYKDVQTAENSSPIKTPLRMAGAIPAALALPGSPAAGGALAGGLTEAMDANPDEGIGKRAGRTAIGTGAGAVLGKVGQKIGTIGASLLPKVLGGAGGADANVIARQAARAASAKQLYGAALAEGKVNEITPQLSSFLQEDDIAPIVERIQSGRTGSQMETPELLDRVYKELSDAERAAKKPLAGIDPTKPNAAISRVADIRAAKGKLLNLMSSPGERPPITLDVSPETYSVDPTVTDARDAMQGPLRGGQRGETLPGHETITGPIPEGTAGTARGNQAQVSLDANGKATAVSPSDVQGPAGPSFMLRGQPPQIRHAIPGTPAFQLRANPGKITPGVEINTPAMRVQTAPAEAMPATMPSYAKAVEDYAQRTKGIDAVKKGYQAVQGGMSGNLPSMNSLGRKTPLAFADWAKTATPEEIAAARQGITGAVKDASALPGKMFGPMRRAAGVAGPLLRDAPSPNQSTLDMLRNLGVLETANSVP